MDNRKQIMKKKWIERAFVVFVWLAIWQVAAWCIHNEILFAGPVTTMQYLGNMLIRVGFWQTCALSLLRIGTGFLLALICGCLLGMAALKWHMAEKLLSPFLLFCKAVPVASFAVIFLIWWGADGISLAICFLVTLPVVYVNFLEGMRNVDEKLLQMAGVFRISRRAMFLSLYRPALAPFMAGCFKTALGMGIKAGVAAEVIGISNRSIGGEIYLSKIYLDTAGVFAWTIVVIVLSFGIEKGVLALWNRFCRMRVSVPVKKQMHREKACGITFSGLCKSYGQQVVLNDVSATVRAGEVCCLMAPSGAGKTTLLHILAGLVKPDTGRVSAGCEEPVGVSGTIALSPAMVFQEDRLCEEETALQNVMLTGCGRQEAAECLGRLLPPEALHKPVKALSGGMRRRVCIARALVAEGNVLLLDEPFSGLDDETKRQVIEVIRIYQKDRAIILATHEEKDIEIFAGRKVEITPTR